MNTVLQAGVDAFAPTSAGTTTGIMALAGAMLGIAIVVGIVLWVYNGFAWMTIAKKLKYDKGWIAFIPIANFFLYPILAKKHWAWGFIMLVPLVNIVFLIMWMWKIFEFRKYPGWLSLVFVLFFIPFVNMLAELAYLIIIGLVAWADR